MIRFVCATCKEKLAVPDRHAGRRGKCPLCGSINRVPTASDAFAPTAATAAPAVGATAAPLIPQPHRPQAALPQDEIPRAHAAATSVRPTRAPPGFIERLVERVSRKPAKGGELDLDVYDSGGITPAVKLLFVLGILVLVPLAIGAGFVIMILLRVKLGN